MIDKDNQQYDIIEEDTNEDAKVDEEKEKKYTIKSFFVDLIVYLIIIFISIKIIPTYIAQRTIVDGSSMMNTLHNNDNLIVEKISYRFSKIKRFDIIVFHPYGKETDEYYVKRIIGLPNETIKIEDGNIYINDDLLDENYGKEEIKEAGLAETTIKLLDDEYFVLGDNRNHSSDSRAIGPVIKDNIVGKAIFRIWPLSKMSTLK